MSTSSVSPGTSPGQENRRVTVTGTLNRDWTVVIADDSKADSKLLERMINTIFEGQVYRSEKLDKALQNICPTIRSLTPPNSEVEGAEEPRPHRFISLSRVDNARDAKKACKNGQNVILFLDNNFFEVPGAREVTPDLGIRVATELREEYAGDRRGMVIIAMSTDRKNFSKPLFDHSIEGKQLSPEAVLRAFHAAEIALSRAI